MTGKREEAMIPKTRKAAIAMLVEQDVAKWGENERAASRRAHGHKTIGLALNTLAARAQLSDADGWPELRAAAEENLTDADWSSLRDGG